VTIATALIVCAIWRAAAVIASAEVASGSACSVSISRRYSGSCSVRRMMRFIILTASIG
jgi:hypothetical protein